MPRLSRGPPPHNVCGARGVLARMETYRPVPALGRRTADPEHHVSLTIAQDGTVPLPGPAPRGPIHQLVPRFSATYGRWNFLPAPIPAHLGSPLLLPIRQLASRPFPLPHHSLSPPPLLGSLSVPPSAPSREQGRSAVPGPEASIPSGVGPSPRT